MQLLSNLRYTTVALVIVAALSSLPWVLRDRFASRRSSSASPNPSSAPLPPGDEAHEGGHAHG